MGEHNDFMSCQLFFRNASNCLIQMLKGVKSLYRKLHIASSGCAVVGKVATVQLPIWSSVMLGTDALKVSSQDVRM